jgi:hypothetical protein
VGFGGEPDSTVLRKNGRVELGSKITELGKPLLEVSYGWRRIKAPL